ncbi:ketoacyl-ACP synthase III [Bremerella cremea]|uniref:3-oxoacyl-ACP synthase n=1 Tax=Blastopirellula marina TaxID=124 RepID=A0A2S8G096_9BACT|nr:MULTISPECIES: ketoacyl-ACP synthase III [Pirellulaceae]PQO37856.1 hypothetical protein C5Y83_07900 [Blastopirellula marina]RCS50244.1 ketoacyl-ACP synthase III [Bremerella cremea]
MDILIKDVASALPDQILTDETIYQTSGNSSTTKRMRIDQLISRTGVQSRPILPAGYSILDLAEQACRIVLRRQPGSPIDGLIFCSQTQEARIPAYACILHGRLELPPRCAAFDIGLACSSYIYGLQTASGWIRSGICSNVLVVTADAYSRHLSRDDLASRVLFGDAASATLVAKESGRLLISNGAFGTDGRCFQAFWTPHSDLDKRTTNKGSIICMNGRDVASFVIREMPKAISAYLKTLNLELDQIDQFIFHQASMLLLERLRKSLGIEADRFLINLNKTGNLVGSSIPHLLSNILHDRFSSIENDSRVLFGGFGAGMSWGLMAGRIVKPS